MRFQIFSVVEAIQVKFEKTGVRKIVIFLSSAFFTFFFSHLLYRKVLYLIRKTQYQSIWSVKYRRNGCKINLPRPVFKVLEHMGHPVHCVHLYRVAHMFSPSLKSICGLTGQTFSQFQILSQFYSIRAFERCI